MLCPYIQQKGEGKELKIQAFKGLEKRLANFGLTAENPEAVHKKYFERLHYELEVINKMRFSGYFMIMADFIQ